MHQASFSGLIDYSVENKPLSALSFVFSIIIINEADHCI